MLLVINPSGQKRVVLNNLRNVLLNYLPSSLCPKWQTPKTEPDPPESLRPSHSSHPNACTINKYDAIWVIHS